MPNTLPALLIGNTAYSTGMWDDWEENRRGKGGVTIMGGFNEWVEGYTESSCTLRVLYTFGVQCLREQRPEMSRENRAYAHAR